MPCALCLVPCACFGTHAGTIACTEYSHGPLNLRASPADLRYYCSMYQRIVMTCRLQGRKCTETRAWEALGGTRGGASAEKKQRGETVQSCLVLQKRYTSFLSLSIDLFPFRFPSLEYLDPNGVETRAVCRVGHAHERRLQMPPRGEYP